MTVLAGELDVLTSDDLDQELRELRLETVRAKKEWMIEAKKEWMFNAKKEWMIEAGDTRRQAA